MSWKDPFDHLSDTAKHWGDGLSVLTVVGTLADMLPSIAAILTIVWTGIRIYETATVQRLLGRAPVATTSKD
jgi:hypothetical protein